MLSIILLAFVGAQAGVNAGPTPTAQTPEPSRERLICRSRPVLGSRIASQRICRTAEDWRLHEHDLEQSRRDINDRGARGCPTC